MPRQPFSGKRTGWLSPWLKPIRRGVFERKLLASVVFSYWDGKLWHAASDSIAKAKRKPISGYQDSDFAWRGLAAKV